MRKGVAFLLGPLVAVLCLASAPAQGTQSTPWCSSEELLEQNLRRDPSLGPRREAVEERRRAQIETGATSGPFLMIPVVVHVVHRGGAVGTGENLSYAQVLSQIQALQRDFENSLGLPGAVDTGIRFCLAKNPPSGQSWANPSEPGVTRTASSLTQHDIGTQEAALKALAFFPSDRYLNIWVVKGITPAGVVGYAQFPGTVPASLDGIVMRFDAFGSNLLPPGGTFQLLPDNQDGKILGHEVGHYLDLYHTFHGGCYGLGDQVADTAAEATSANACPIGRSTCGQTDPIDNFMDYTNDTCRVAFTALQAERMRDAILIYRPGLVDSVNLVTTGCVNGALPTIQVDAQQVCAGQAVKFSTVSSAAQYDWSFPGGSPASASGVGPHVVTYASPGVYDASLTTNNAAGTDPRSLTKQGLVNVSACVPIASSQGNWFFGHFGELHFSTGIPQPGNQALTHNTIKSPEACLTQSDASGNLLFYSDGRRVWNNQHTQAPLTLLGGSDSTQVLSIPNPTDPDPANPISFYLITVAGYVSGNAINGAFTYTKVSSSGSNLAFSAVNTPIALPTGADNRITEMVTAVPACGTNYWVIVHGSYLDANLAFKYALFVYPLTASGIGTPAVYPIAGPARFGQLKASPDGAKIAYGTGDSRSADGNNSGYAYVFDFDRNAGVLSNPRVINRYAYGVSFSPDSQLLYLTDSASSSNEKIFQYDLSAGNINATEVLAANVPEQYSALQLGPDKKLYVALNGNNNHLAVINNPDQRNTLLSPNACGYSYNGPFLNIPPTGTAVNSSYGLPNMIDALKASSLPPNFSYTILSCGTANFLAPACASSYTWDFGDSTTSSIQNPTHTYASPGTYNVQLTVTSGAGTTTVTKPVKVGMTPLSIAGPLNGCAKPSNYSINAELGVSYTWQISGGTSAITTGNNVDVIWGANGGTVQVTAMDSATGCQTTASLPVGRCGPGCGGGTREPCPTCQSTWEAPCKSPGTATAAVTFCNNSTTSQVYAWSLAGLPVIPGGPCIVEGPTEFVPASGQMAVGPGACETTPVTVTCQGGQPESAHGCFQLNGVEVNTGAGLTCSGSTLISRRWLWKVDKLFYDIPFGRSNDVFFTVTNLDTVPAVLDYTFSVMPSDMRPAEPIARLNGNPPGVHVPGTLQLGPGSSARVGVNVAFTEPKPMAPQDLLVSADLEGNGSFVVIASAGLRSSLVDCNGNGIGDAEDIAHGTSSDCDANGIPDECDLAAHRPDCNQNGILDSCEVASGSTPDVNLNQIPDSCEIHSVSWYLHGTAQGGQVIATIQGFSATCTVTITTTIGNSAAMVATQLVAALNASPCLAGQNITSVANGRQVRVTGFALYGDRVSIQITDPGLMGQEAIVSIPVLSPWGLLLLALLLLAIGWRFAIRQRGPESRGRI